MMKVPRHIALIPDGNRRWAEERGKKPWEGHAKGIDVFKKFLDWCYDLGVEEITAYSLSTENLQKRNQTEMSFLFEIYQRNLLDMLNSKEVIDRETQVRFVGDLSGFPPKMKGLIEQIERRTAKFEKKKLNLCVNYSGRSEIVNAMRKLAESEKDINEKNLEEFLLVNTSPDLLIRTAERRISNFLLWQCAYSEIYFSPKFFPDFTREDFLDAIEQFNSTERRYGK